jgi:hypothetical protein
MLSKGRAGQCVRPFFHVYRLHPFTLLLNPLSSPCENKTSREGLFEVKERVFGKAVGDGCALPTALVNLVCLSPPVKSTTSWGLTPDLTGGGRRALAFKFVPVQARQGP